MNLLAYILAERDFGWIEIVIVVILFGASLIGSLFQKAKEKQQEEKRRGNSGPPGRRQTQAPARRTVQPTRTAPPPPPAGQTVRVSQELHLRQQRQVQLDSDREKRLATRKSPESDTNAIEAHLVSVHPSEADTAPRQISTVGVIPGLKTLDDARKAIILHEIFSPPKALRKGGEMWDT